MTPDQILTKTADLLESNGWTQGTYAKNADGVSVAYYDPTACAFCVMGAINRVAANDHSFSNYAKALDRLRRVTIEQIMTWNDEPNRTKEEVVQALRSA